MRVSHICLGCGMDLWRVRALPEAVYGLRVVVCPGCGRAAVRGGGAAPRWRVLRRAIVSLGVRVAALGFVLGATVLVCASFDSADFAGSRLNLAGLWQAIRAAEENPADAFAARVVVVVLAAGGVVVGVWLRTGLGHWDAWSAFAAWLGASLFLISLPEMLPAVSWLYAMGLLVAAGSGEVALSGAPDASGWIERIEALLVLAAVSPIGMLMVHSRQRGMATPSSRARRLGRRLARARRRRRRDR